MKTCLLDLGCFSLAWQRLQPKRQFVSVLGLLGLLIVPAPVAAAETVTNQDSGGMLAALVIAISIAVALAVLAIYGLVHWSRKQEHISDMMLFCMKYLLQSEDEAERCASARALGRADDTGALLVLVDVISDEEETEAVRNAASEALHEMGARFRKRKNVVTSVELEVEQRDFRGLIEILTANFERGKMSYAQSAYIIGRHYMRLERYSDARDWLTKAEFRNRKFNLYGNRIKHWIQVCNTRLLAEANDSYKSADYHRAKEHYAVFDHGLKEQDKQHCAVYLRLACVYCKLKDYQNAEQSLLQAMEHNHETDLALTLTPLLQKILSHDAKKAESKHELEAIKSAIDERVDAIMNTLLAREFLR